DPKGRTQAFALDQAEVVVGETLDGTVGGEPGLKFRGLQREDGLVRSEPERQGSEGESARGGAGDGDQRAVATRWIEPDRRGTGRSRPSVSGIERFRNRGSKQAGRGGRLEDPERERDAPFLLDAGDQLSRNEGIPSEL